MPESAVSKRVYRRMLGVAFLMWVPPALLSMIRGEPATISFLSDCALHARALVTAPLLILSTITCLPLLREMACHFARLASDSERDLCDACIAGFQPFKIPAGTAVICAFCAYAVVLLLFSYVPVSVLPAWQKDPGEGIRSLSPAGWWHWLISVPLLLGLVFGWLWRLFSWTRFLWQMSHLKLRLIAAHPDNMAGLRFLAYSPIAFLLPSFALGATAAGMVANRVLNFGESPAGYKGVMIGAVVAVVILFCGPLTLFAGKLFNAKRRGILRYSGLTDEVGFRWERKWLDRASDADLGERALEANDFSAVTDLYQTVENVYRVRLIPLDLRSLICVSAAALLPFGPVVLLALPFMEIIRRLAKLLI